MRVTPLVYHAAATVPQISDKFSNTVGASISSIFEGPTTVTCEAPHGLTVGTNPAVCIRDAKVLVPITDADFLNEDILLTFADAHHLVDNPDEEHVEPWNANIELTGFTNPLMNATHEFVATVGTNQCLIKAPEGVSLDLTADVAMYEPTNFTFTGWHPVNVINDTEFTIPTPSGIQHDTVAVGATVATDIRISGALSFAHIAELYSQENGATVNDLRMFISPQATTAMSKDRSAKTSAVAEISESVTFRQMLLDGFHVTVVVPTTGSRSGLLEADLCQGEILKVVLAVFQGLIPQQPDLLGAKPFSAVLKTHGGLLHERAYYVHEFEFEAPVQLSNDENIKPWQATQGAQIETVPPEQVGSTQPLGTTPLAELKIDGIYNGKLGEPLTASIQYEDQT